MFDFWRLFLEQLPETSSVFDAYEAAEKVVFAEYGRRRFRSYKTFRSAKCRFLKSKTVIRVHVKVNVVV